MNKYHAIKKCGLLLMLVATAGCGRVQKAEAQQPPVKKEEPVLIHKTVVLDRADDMQFVNNSALFSEHWDTLSQPKFWRQIIALSPDSCIINIASTRTPVQTTCYKNWCSQTESDKSFLKSKIREQYNISEAQELFVTNGKREFYEHRKSIPTISKAVSYFNEFGVDPWYAQTILLIESPGKCYVKSYAGANGPFQLMRGVATMYGLKVNKRIDERADLKRSAYGASRLLSTVCIPKVKALLDAHNIAYKETDLWFRLLVLHAYHAGAGNVACAINSINPTQGEMQLITTLWHTECGGFRNESQNYSQIALAALLNFEDIMRMDGDTIFMVQGDRKYDLFQAQKKTGKDAAAELQNCLQAYERDFVDGIISFDYFMNRTLDLRKELAKATGHSTDLNSLASIYPSSDEHYLLLSNELLTKRKTDEAIKLLKFNIDNYPKSAGTAETLGKAYRITGNMGLSQKFMAKSYELSNN